MDDRVGGGRGVCVCACIFVCVCLLAQVLEARPKDFVAFFFK